MKRAVSLEGIAELNSIYRMEGKVKPLSHKASRWVERGWVYRSVSGELSLTNKGYAVLCSKMELTPAQIEGLKALGADKRPSKVPMPARVEWSLRKRGLVRGHPARLTLLGYDCYRVVTGTDPATLTLTFPEN